MRARRSRLLSAPTHDKKILLQRQFADFSVGFMERLDGLAIFALGRSVAASGHHTLPGLFAPVAD